MLEMVCASVCITSMTCFTLEKNRCDRAFDLEAGMNRHRLGARGNATSFPLPWHELLEQFENGKEENKKRALILPNAGEELSNFVSVILKTQNNDDEVDGQSLARFIHQAIVRRDVVVRLIDNARRRGHRAYRDIDMTKVVAKATEELPVNDVPACVVLLKEMDDLLKISKSRKQRRQFPVGQSLRR